MLSNTLIAVFPGLRPKLNLRNHVEKMWERTFKDKHSVPACITSVLEMNRIFYNHPGLVHSEMFQASGNGVRANRGRQKQGK